ncbi:MAG: AAA family ATPase [Acidimicrobiales bacterium]
MTVLVFLNGPPASGKSTLAARFVEQRPLALNLDVDVVRAMLGRWIDSPLGDMYDAFRSMVDQRPATRRVEVIRDDIDATMAKLEGVLATGDA